MYRLLHLPEAKNKYNKITNLARKAVISRMHVLQIKFLLTINN